MWPRGSTRTTVSTNTPIPVQLMRVQRRGPTLPIHLGIQPDVSIVTVAARGRDLSHRIRGSEGLDGPAFVHGPLSLGSLIGGSNTAARGCATTARARRPTSVA